MNDQHSMADKHPGDTLEVLSHTRNRLAKTWRADGSIAPYDLGKFFTRAAARVSDLNELSALLRELEAQPTKALIRGRFCGMPADGLVRKTLENFEDQPLHSMLIDVDGFEPITADPLAEPDQAVAEFIATVLPAAFHGAGHHWQLSNSAGHPNKPGLRAHIWFWLELAHTSAQLYAWAKATSGEIDKALFQPTQWHYTSNPVFEHGVLDPVAVRTGLVAGPCVRLDASAIKAAAPARSSVVLTAPRRADDIDDPDADTLFELGVVLDQHADGKLDVVCPWADEHTPGGSTSATTYFPRGVGGPEQQAGFKCHHDHCAGRTIFDYRRAVGLDVVADDFGAIVDAATGELVEVVSPKHSDDQLALAFAATASKAVRYTPGMGWMSAAEHHWERDDHLHRMTLSRGICRDAAGLADKPHERRSLASARTVNAVVTLAQSDVRLLVPATAWDADPMALNTPRGIVNLRTGAMSHRSGDLVTRAARVSPDFEAACPHWMYFLDAVCAGDAEMVEFLQRLLGYMLTGDRREQKLFFIWGKGANGKSTLGDLLLWLLGGYGLKLSSSVLMQSAHDRHPTELAQLHGVRAAVSSELEEGQFFNESRVKELTGDATLSARFMRGDFFEFAMSHKHLIVGNHKPRLKGGDPAMARRLVLIPFRAAFSGAAADQDMPAKLRAEAPAILAWMVRGAVNWAAAGLALPAAVRAASDEYLAEHNDVELWMGDRCERAATFRDKAGQMYADFAAWKLTRGERAPSAVTWAERMTLIPGIQKIRSNGAHYTGVRLTSGADAVEFA